MPAAIAVIVPVLNEARGIQTCLDALRAHEFAEVIIVDGGSQDATREIVKASATPTGNRAGSRIVLIESTRGRANQMNTGAQAATADVLLFQHADTLLPGHAVARCREVIEAGAVWGRFDVRFNDHRGLLPLVAWLMNWRSRLSGICTGDQAIFVRRDVFERLGGYAAIPLMEDIELSRRLKREARPARISDPVTTSARRWIEHGVLRTIVRMWWLRLRYFLGAPADRLARAYPDVREP